MACHGYSHQLGPQREPEIFREETLRSKQLLEEIIQPPVRGYRAASYSITETSLWALDILAEAGFDYDSSIFPVRHDRYGIPDTEDPHPAEDSTWVFTGGIPAIDRETVQLSVTRCGWWVLSP